MSNPLPEVTPHIIYIDAEYVRYSIINSTTHCFTVKVTDLIARQQEGKVDDDGKPYWILKNSMTGNIVYVSLDEEQTNAHIRTYTNTEDPNRIIKLIIK